MNREREIIQAIIDYPYALPDHEEALKEYAKEYHKAEVIKSWEQQQNIFLRGIDANPFIEVPCVAYNDIEQEITNKTPDACELMELVRKIDRNRIESYREATPLSDFREEAKIWTQVVMQSGDYFIVNLPLKDFEKLFHPTNQTTS